MSRIRGKDTTPEKAVRSMLHRMGYRFRLNTKIPIQLRKQGNRKGNSSGTAFAIKYDWLEQPFRLTFSLVLADRYSLGDPALDRTVDLHRTEN